MSKPIKYTQRPKAKNTSSSHTQNDEVTLFLAMVLESRHLPLCSWLPTEKTNTKGDNLSMTNNVQVEDTIDKERNRVTSCANRDDCIFLLDWSWLDTQSQYSD